jgi:hypothetical protein
MLRALFKFATNDARQKRELTCTTCEHKKTLLIDYCGKCGCSIRTKTVLRREKCPEGKW